MHIFWFNFWSIYPLEISNEGDVVCASRFLLQSVNMVRKGFCIYNRDIRMWGSCFSLDAGYDKLRVSNMFSLHMLCQHYNLVITGCVKPLLWLTLFKITHHTDTHPHMYLTIQSVTNTDLFYSCSGCYRKKDYFLPACSA